MKRVLLVWLIFLIAFNAVRAQYQVNNNIQSAWMLLMDLKIDEAKQLLQKELAQHPENYYVYYLDQTCDAYGLLINSDDKEYEAFLDNFEAKRKIMDGKYEDSPYYLFCKSEMDLQVAVFKIIHGSQFSGMKNAYNAYREVYQNLEMYPDFKPGRKLDGFFNVAMSNMPPFVKWAVSFFGVTSDFDYGVKLLDSLYQTQKNIRGINAEAALFIIFTAKINKTPEMVYRFTQTLDTNIRNLYIHQYFRANIAYRTGHNEQALTTLHELDSNNSAYANLIYNYLKGKVLLRKLDEDAAKYINNYLAHLKKPEYYKEMTYNLALTYLIKGNREKYHTLCREVINNGNEINERDREALYDASLDYEPDIELAKARLLLDGGYLNRFKRAIKSYEDEHKTGLPYQLEYNLLMGRFEIKQNHFEQAKSYLEWVLSHGADEDYYFACAAALYLGNIYEKQGLYEKAKSFYKQSSGLYDSDYYEYLGDKADKGVARMKKLLEKSP